MAKNNKPKKVLLAEEAGVIDHRPDLDEHYVADSETEEVEENIFATEEDDDGPETYMGDDNRMHMILDFKGYVFDFVPVRLRDQRVLYIIGKLQNTDDPEKIMKLQSRFFDIILGDDAFDVMDNVAETSGGILDEKVFAEFVGYLFEQAQAKN